MLPNDVPTPADDSHGPHHHLPSTGHPWLDKILPISALLVSAISIGIAIHHGNIMNEMAKANERAAAASVWPFLSLDDGNWLDGKTALYMKIKNSGVGPAKLESFQLFYKGKPMRNFGYLIKTCCVDASTTDTKFAEDFSASGAAPTTASVATTVIAEKDSNPVFEWASAKVTMPYWSKLDQTRRKGEITLRACYCSVFGQCWTSNLVDTTQTPISSCPTNVVQFQDANYKN